MPLVWLSLGTNLGEREANLAQAVTALADVMAVTAVSSIYETPPWGVTRQPAFLNMCVGGETAVCPTTLLTRLQRVESRLGRTVTYRWGPRLIDIDILFYGNMVLQTADLTIPHPHMVARAFVLVPLAEIAADWVHPQMGVTVAELLGGVDATPVVRVG